MLLPRNVIIMFYVSVRNRNSSEKRITSFTFMIHGYDNIKKKIGLHSSYTFAETTFILNIGTSAKRLNKHLVSISNIDLQRAVKIFEKSLNSSVYEKKKIASRHQSSSLFLRHHAFIKSEKETIQLASGL